MVSDPTEVDLAGFVVDPVRAVADTIAGLEAERAAHPDRYETATDPATGHVTVWRRPDA